MNLSPTFLTLQHPHKHKKRKLWTSLLAVGVGSEVVVWNVSRGEKYKTLVCPLSFRLSSMHDVTSVFILTQDSGHSDMVNCVSWGPENRALYSGSSDRHVAEWSIEGGHCIR